MADNERILRALLYFALDQQTVRETKAGVLSVEDALERVEEQAERTERQMQLLRDAADVGEQIAEGFLAASAVIGGPLLLSLNAYVQEAGQADSISREWLDAQQRLGDAQRRVGRVVAEQALPALEKAAELAGRAADFAERNPELVGAALKFAAILGGLGVVGVATARTAKFVADAGELLSKVRILVAGKALAGAGAGAAGAGAVGAGAGTAGAIAGVGASVLGGLGAGFLGYEALARTGVGQTLGMESGTAGKALALVAHGLGGLVGKGDEAFQAVGRWTGVLEDTGEAADRSTATLERRNQETEMISQAQLDNYIAFQEEQKAADEQYEMDRIAIQDRYQAQSLHAEERYGSQRTAIVEQYGAEQARRTETFARQQTQADAQYNDCRVQMAADFARQQAEAEAAYYAQRAQRAQQYGLEAARMEEDHQRDLARMRRDYERQITDAEMSRDAIALYEARRNYEERRQDTEADYAVQAARRAQDYALQMQQMEQAFHHQQAARAADYERRREESREQYERERQRREEEYARREQEAREARDERLQALDEQYAIEQEKLEAKNNEDLDSLETRYNRESAERKTAFQNELTDLGTFLGTERETRQQYYGRMEDDFRTWLRSMRSAIPGSSRDVGAGGRQLGGYAGLGRYTLGEGGREFVMSNATTRAAESAIGGGALSQDSVLAAIGHGGGGINMTISPSFSNVGASDQAWIRNELATLARQIQDVPRQLVQAMGGY